MTGSLRPNKQKYLQFHFVCTCVELTKTIWGAHRTRVNLRSFSFSKSGTQTASTRSSSAWSRLPVRAGIFPVEKGRGCKRQRHNPKMRAPARVRPRGPLVFLRWISAEREDTLTVTRVLRQPERVGIGFCLFGLNDFLTIIWTNPHF